MGLPPNSACNCNCGSLFYNVRKMRISDGHTVWHRLPNVPSEFPSSLTTVNAAKENAVLAPGCCDAARVIVNLMGYPFCLSVTTGNTIWADENRRLPDGISRYRVIDADDSGNWIGAFTNEPLGMIDGNNVRQWSFPGSFSPTRVKLGGGDFVAYNGVHGFAYGNTPDGSLIYDNNNAVNAPSATEWISEIISHRAQSYYATPFNTPPVVYTFDLPSFQFVPPFAYDDDGGETNDAATQVIGGRQTLFYATHYAGSRQDFRTGQSMFGLSGIMKVEIANPTSFLFSMLDLGSIPWRIHRCLDGIVAIFSGSSFTYRGKTFEIVKCDFDLNVQWMKRWTQLGTYPGLIGHPIGVEPSSYGLRGISGDNEHVYISGSEAVWGVGHV